METFWVVFYVNYIFLAKLNYTEQIFQLTVREFFDEWGPVVFPELDSYPTSKLDFLTSLSRVTLVLNQGLKA
jgi:hypothetical protein